jgi:hypothetical protein
VEVRLQVQDSLLLLEISEVFDPVLGKGLPQLDRPGSAHLQPMPGSPPEHLRSEVLEAPLAKERGSPRHLNEGDTRLVVGDGRPVELLLP